MLRQAVFAPSRALRPASRSISQRSLAYAQTFVTPIPVRSIRPAAAAARWYSNATNSTAESQKESSNTEAKTAAETSETSAEGAEDSVVTELRKKLETKEKEALEWKVSKELIRKSLS